MAFEFKLPDIGEGITEGEIVKWLVKEGEHVDEDQAILEIMTDKATVEITSPKSGRIEKLLAQEGDVVPIGGGLTLIGEGGAFTKKISPPPTPKEKAKPTSSPDSGQNTTPIVSPVTTAALPSRSDKVLASPATRRLAREMGIDLTTIQSTDLSGRVLKNDLLSMGVGATSAGKPFPAISIPSTPISKTKKIVEFGKRKPNQPTSDEERIPLRGIRKKIAEHMVKSIHTAAHFTHIDEVDMTEIVSLRHQYQAAPTRPGVKLTYLPFIVRAASLALREFPAMNSSLDNETGEIILKHYYNIGFAVATNNDDLVVPVIKDANQKSTLDIANEIQTIGEKARKGRLTLTDLQGGTFTITSMGNLGGLFATPIINFPEVGILGFHKIIEKPVVKNHQVVVRNMANLSLSLDHRVVDGAIGASFLNRMIHLLEHPALLLLDG